MTLVRTTMKDVKSRYQSIGRLLRPLRPLARDGKPALISCSPIGCSSSQYGLATYDGSQPATNHGTWRFATFVPGIKGSYFERWLRTETNGREWWCLEKAYLHFFHLNPYTKEETEFLCLHCDPSGPEDAPHAEYKKGPHLHLVRAKPPFPSHAHIALYPGDLDRVLDSVTSLSEATEQAVLMVAEEVLDPLRVGGWREVE